MADIKAEQRERERFVADEISETDGIDSCSSSQSSDGSDSKLKKTFNTKQRIFKIMAR